MNTTTPESSRPFQFTIRQLLILTTVASVVLAIVRYAGWEASFDRFIPCGISLLIGVGMMLTAGVIPWLIAGDERRNRAVVLRVGGVEQETEQAGERASWLNGLIIPLVWGLYPLTFELESRWAMESEVEWTAVALLIFGTYRLARRWVDPGHAWGVTLIHGVADAGLYLLIGGVIRSVHC